MGVIDGVSTLSKPQKNGNKNMKKGEIMIDKEPFPLLSELRKEYKKTNYGNRYEKMFTYLNDKNIQEIKELKAYATSELDALNKISIAVSIVGMASATVPKNKLFTTICLLVNFFYLCFAFFNVKKHHYIVFICTEKLKEIE